MATVKKLFSLDESLANELENVAAVLHKSQKEIVENALDFYFDYTVFRKISQRFEIFCPSRQSTYCEKNSLSCG